MDRRVKVIVFFLIVFALPVAWYLFLQFFGKNNFALEQIGEYAVESCEFNGPVLLTRDDLVMNYPNEFDRISKYLNGQGEINFFGIDSLCMMGEDMLLIDKEMRIWGKYKASREDVDRMMAEVGIFLMNNLNEGVEK